MKDKTPKMEILTETSQIAAGTDQTIDVLLRITAPERAASNAPRPKLNIGIALDRSGSMAGEKMLQAREAAKYCVDQLLPTDTFSAVIFDDNIDVLFTNQRAADPQTLKRGIDRITDRGSTALHAGWVQAGMEVAEGLDPAAINRVLLITDGQANAGETRTDRIVTQARELANRSVTTSTIGIGADFNEDLLIPMAEAGGGNSWHVREPADMVAIFETELQGLIMQFASSVVLSVKTTAGVRLTDVLNDFDRDRKGRYILPNLRHGAPLEIVVRLHVPAQAAGKRETLAYFDLTYTTQSDKRRERVISALEREFAQADAVKALPKDGSVFEAVELLTAARARQEVVNRMDRGDIAGAGEELYDLFNRAAFALEARPTPRLRREVEELSELKEQYASRENDAMTRKRMTYAREMRRKGKM